MTSIELKSNIKKIIDRINNERMLQAIYDFLKAKEDDKDEGAWSSLTEEEKQEILTSFDESEEEKNLIEAKKVFKKLK